VAGARRTDDDDAARDDLNGSSLRIAVVVARFNEDVTRKLQEGALAELARLRVAKDAIEVVHVPGALELPLAAKTAAASARFDAVVCLGCVIRGGTDHYRWVCAGTVEGIVRAALDTGVPVLFGVLTVTDEAQALARVAKGAETARAAVETAHALRRLR
jgi:6,7-dimethyl-8-ribityllumazine synthase